jgi:hypothetical protein
VRCCGACACDDISDIERSIGGTAAAASVLQASGFRSDVTVFRLDARPPPKTGSDPAFRRNTPARVYRIEPAHKQLEDDVGVERGSDVATAAAQSLYEGHQSSYGASRKSLERRRYRLLEPKGLSNLSRIGPTPGGAIRRPGRAVLRQRHRLSARGGRPRPRPAPLPASAPGA